MPICIVCETATVTNRSSTHDYGFVTTPPVTILSYHTSCNHDYRVINPWIVIKAMNTHSSNSDDIVITDARVINESLSRDHRLITA